MTEHLKLNKSFDFYRCKTVYHIIVRIIKHIFQRRITIEFATPIVLFPKAFISQQWPIYTGSGLGPVLFFVFHQENMSVKCISLTSHFYIEKLGFAGCT